MKCGIGNDIACRIKSKYIFHIYKESPSELTIQTGITVYFLSEPAEISDPFNFLIHLMQSCPCTGKTLADICNLNFDVRCWLSSLRCNGFIHYYLPVTRRQLIKSLHKNRTVVLFNNIFLTFGRFYNKLETILLISLIFWRKVLQKALYYVVLCRNV